MIKIISMMRVSTMVRLTLTAVALYYVYQETHAVVLTAVLVMLCAGQEAGAVLHRMHSIKFNVILKFAEEIDGIMARINKRGEEK